MDTALSRKTYERGVNAYFLYIGAVTLVYGLLMAKISRSWAIADWLINYQGGFVRRGLPGEIAFRLGHLLHVSPVAFAVIFYLVPYAVFLWAMRELAMRSAPKLWVLALLLSPATLAFQVLDVTAGFHKEMIFLAALAWLVVWAGRKQVSSAAVILFLSVTLTITVLSHESLICFAPYLFAALVFSGRTPLEAAKECALPFALALAMAYVSSKHIGDTEIATKICTSLGYTLLPQGNEICSGGAIAYLAWSRQMARDFTLRVLHAFPYLRVYSCCFVLSILPLIAEAWHWREPGSGARCRFCGPWLALALRARWCCLCMRWIGAGGFISTSSAWLSCCFT